MIKVNTGIVIKEQLEIRANQEGKKKTPETLP